MYSVTIAKITFDNIWAGFILMSELLLLGDLKRECIKYNSQFEPCEIGDLKIIETTWNNLHVMIQYRRIS